MGLGDHVSAGDEMSRIRKPKEDGTYASLRDHIGVKRPDHFQTPPHALDPLWPYLPDKGGWVWDPACGKGNLVGAFRDRHYQIFSTDVEKGFNFLTWRPEFPIEEIDYIVTNPPYSIKDEFLERAYDLGRPFAFLMPLTTLEGVKRQALFRRFGIEVVMMEKRINFETPSGKGSSSWFATAWFTWGLGIGRDLTFTTSKEEAPLQHTLL